jgi:ribonuclease R
VTDRMEAEGRIVVHTRGFGFVRLDEAIEGVESAFIAPPDLHPFLADDRVRATLERGRQQRWSAKKIELLERERTALFGEVTTHKGRPHLRVDRMVANTDWPLEGDFEDGAFVRGIIQEDHVVHGEEIPETEASLERVLARYGVRSQYPEEVENTSTALSLKVLRNRRDLRDLTTVTIDAPTSRDLDDALTVLPAGPDGAVRVLVSISDVDALVPEGSPADEEARLRGTSVYLAGRVVPMLPPSLSEEALSLLPGQDRPAMTVELRVDVEGAVTAVDLYPSVICSDRRLTYEEVAAFLDRNEAGELPDDVVEALRWLRTAFARIDATRRARGGVRFVREEATIQFDEETGEPREIAARTDTAAHTLVERLMVAANEAVARWLVDRGLPGIFRVHETPDAEAVGRLAESARHLGFETGLGDVLTPRGLAALEAQFEHSTAAPSMDTVLQRALGPARYTVYADQHFGLAAPLYLHFTSPIRRYADLTVHRVIKRYLSGDRSMAAGDERFEKLAVHLNEQSRRATRAERERLRMVAARWFEGRIGERFTGDVVAVKPFGLIVQLRGTGVAGSIQSDLLPGGPFEVGPAGHRYVGEGATYTVGQSFEVEVLSTDDELGRINLGLT